MGMDARDFLTEYRRAGVSIAGLRAQLDSMYDSYKSPGFDTMPGPIGQTPSPVADLVEKREEIRNRLMDEIMRQRDIQMEIDAVILQVPDATEREVLFHRYIDCWQWDMIADDIGYERRQTMRYHDSALQHVQDILDSGKMSQNVTSK